MTIESGENVDITVGNALPLESIPVGFTVHNIELNLGRGGQLARSAGTSALVAAKEGEYPYSLIIRNTFQSIGQV